MAFSSYDIGSKNLTKSHRHPYGIRLDGVRNPIGRRTESDRAAYGIRLDGERNPIGRRTESDWTAYANGGTLRGCTCLKCTNRARNVPSASVSKL